MQRALKIMIRSLLVVLLSGYAIMFLVNGAPKVPPPPTSPDSGETKSPFVVKIHARWCPVCMASKPAWTKLQKSFRGRVRFIVFDLTSASSKASSRAEAVGLGLGEFFESHSGRPGTVFVLDGESKEVLAVLEGVQGYQAYAISVEEALKSPPRIAVNGSQPATRALSPPPGR